MAEELDKETLRELRRVKTAANLQQRAAQTTATAGMGAVQRGEYTEPVAAPTVKSKTVVTTTYRGTGKDKVKVVIYSDGSSEEIPEPETGPKTVSSVTYEGKGKDRVKVTKYSDGTEDRTSDPEVTPTEVTPKKIIGYRPYRDPVSGVDYGIPLYEDGTDAFNDRNTWIADWGKNGPQFQFKGSEAKTLTSTYTDPKTGDVVGIYSDGSTEILIKGNGPQADQEYLDAYALLESVFKDYDLEELVPNIKRYMEQGIGSKQATIELKETKAYKTRFAGNEQRRAANLNVLDEATYLALENAYSETLRSYGLQNYFGIDRKGKQLKMANLIGNDIAAPEFKERIDLAVTRVENSDPTVRSTLKTFFNIQDNDLVNYFLNPKEGLPMLQEKVTAAEIGSTALNLGLTTKLESAIELAKLGVTKQAAQEGYSKLGRVLPTASKLSSIYKEEGIDYTQQMGEQEVFKGLASAERARLKLAEREISAFSGSSGTTRATRASDALLSRGGGGLI